MFANSTLFKVEGKSKKKKKAIDTKGYVSLGEDGSFFKDLDQAYINSPTATMAILKFLEHCVPDGLLPKFEKFWKKIASDYIRYGYYLVFVEYNIDGEIIGYEYLNPKNYLIKDVDDNDNASTFISVRGGKVFPTFNPSKAVVLTQIQKDGFEKFAGQIYMYNDTAMPYRITPMFSSLRWMQIEANASIYVDKASDNAMFGNSIFVVKKSSDSSDKELEILEDIKTAISATKGVSEAGQNLLIEYSGDIEDVTKLLHKVSISNEIDVDLFNSTDEKASEKICLSCYGFPQILVKQSEGVFGNSGEAISVATEQWSKTCKREAQNILDGLKEIRLEILKQNNPI